MKFFNADQRPELAAIADRIDGGFLEYNHHGYVLERYWGLLAERFPECQLALCDENETVMGVGNTIPCVWDGTPEALPEGIDEVVEQGFAASRSGHNTLSALLIKVAPGRTRRGLSRLLLEAMRDAARGFGFANLIAPVRPTWKERYPITPIEEYATWTRPDGLPFDPWARTHHRLGADMLRPAPRSMRIQARVADWELWTGLAFPASGIYVFPGGLAPLSVDREGDLGLYYEPNVWYRHRSG